MRPQQPCAHTTHDTTQYTEPSLSSSSCVFVRVGPHRSASAVVEVTHRTQEVLKSHTRLSSKSVSRRALRRFFKQPAYLTAPPRVCALHPRRPRHGQGGFVMKGSTSKYRVSNFTRTVSCRGSCTCMAMAVWACLHSVWAWGIGTILS